MEYDIDLFTNRIREVLRDNFPRESDELNRSKHPKRNGKHLSDLLNDNNSLITKNIDSRMFDLGSPMAEALMPHYHILQNSEVIRKRDRATKTSMGSQGKQENKLIRDYEAVKWNGKTFSKEYTKNVRGERSKARKILEPKLRYNGQYYEDKRGVSNSYVNIHFRYIDRILDATLPYIAQEFGLRAMRKKTNGLQEEYEMQQRADLEDRFSILEIMSSFDE